MIARQSSLKTHLAFFYDFLSHENAKDATSILVSFCSVKTHAKGISALVIETLLILLRTPYIHSDDFNQPLYYHYCKFCTPNMGWSLVLESTDFMNYSWNLQYSILNIELLHFLCKWSCDLMVALLSKNVQERMGGWHVLCKSLYEEYRLL